MVAARHSRAHDDARNQEMYQEHQRRGRRLERLDAREQIEILFAAARFLHCGEESFLVREVLEEKPLGDAGSIRQLTRRGPVKALLGENMADRLDDGGAAILAGEFG